ncbi:WD40 repeat-like protein [Tothia fuscella]|uniref:WD40 repeat-like protein n=1 Tax=Tothia fuscella TaxID=1048955 RepID=A0A9P4TX87_9PEZI|nr:WD40 repeat-like protein [Tothia fuscella]
MEAARAKLLDTLEGVSTLPKLECIASYNNPKSKSPDYYARPLYPNPQTPRTAQWSPDGTCLLTTSADGTLETFVLPSDLLTSETKPLELKPYSTLSNAEPVYSTAVYPHFQLEDFSTTLILNAKKETPIQLTNALAHDAGIYASFPVINTKTEEYMPTHSMIFTPDSNHFIAGGRSMYVVFDINRNGEPPMKRQRTGHRSKGLKSMENVTGPKSVISTLDISCDGVLALGTFNREIGLYEDGGKGQNITSFNVREVPSQQHNVLGHGITQVKWSPCGKYLFVTERRGKGIAVWDVRTLHRKVAFLEGVPGKTNVRSGFDVVRNGGGCEVWAGGEDGKVRIWGDATQKEGFVSCDASWDVHDGIVAETLVHRSGSVLATLSERNRSEQLYDNSESPSSGSDCSTSNDERATGDGNNKLSPQADTARQTQKASREDAMLKIWSIK